MEDNTRKLTYLVLFLSGFVVMLFGLASLL